MAQSSEEMQAGIVRWLWRTVTAPSVQALLPHVADAERLLRSKRIDELPLMAAPGIFGDARIDNLLNLWLKQRRMHDVRNADPDSEHNLRDLLALQGIGVRGYKGTRSR